MAVKFYTVNKEINGVTYTAQFNGIRAALRAIDSTHISDNSDVASNEKLAEYVFENVIVDPRMDVDDFTSVEDMTKVVKFGVEVMQGKFREDAAEPEGTAPAKKSGK